MKKMHLVVGLVAAAFGGSAFGEEGEATTIDKCPTGGDQVAVHQSTSDRATGPKYRKIGLNGFPLPDEKPQQAAESDGAKEETFVDAFTHTLSHETTDIYVPFEGADLSLSVRRNWNGEVWSVQGDISPYVSPTRPFGMGWSTNICPTIQFVLPQQGLISALVTDENGATYRFAVLQGAADGVATVKCLPVPSNRHQQEVMATSLELVTDSSGPKYVFKKKYGTTLTFQAKMTVFPIAPDWDLAHPTYYNFARVLSIEDRWSNKLNYKYNDPVPAPGQPQSYNPIPYEIELRGKKLSITSSGGRIRSITGPNNKTVQYGYDTTTPGLINTLTTVTKPLGSVTTYGYDFHSVWSYADFLDGHTNFYHYVDLVTLTDPNDHTYEITYGFDQSRLSTDSRFFGGAYPTQGTPRVVKSVKLPLPGDVHSTFNNDGMAIRYNTTLPVSLVNPTLTGIVTDCENHEWRYEFSDYYIEDLTTIFDSFRPPSPNTSKNFLLVFQKYTLWSPLAVALGTSPTADKYKMVATFNREAGMALATFKDVSSAVASTYEYNDPFDFANRQPGLSAVSSSVPTKKWQDPTAQVNGEGGRKEFTYDSATRVMKTIKDEALRDTVYTLDSRGNRLTEILKSPGGATTQSTEYVYGTGNFSGIVTKKTVKKFGSGEPTWVSDLVTTYDLDSFGNITDEKVLAGSLPGAAVISWTHNVYDLSNNKTESWVYSDITGSKYLNTKFEYDDLNRLTKVTYLPNPALPVDPAYPSGYGFKQMAYDLRGNKTSEIDEKGNRSLWEYDELNRVVKEARDMNNSGIIDTAAPSDLITTTTYNNLNAKTSVQTPRGYGTLDDYKTKMTYDELNRLSTSKTPLNETTTYQYDGDNCGGLQFGRDFQPTTVIDPRNYRTITIFDNNLQPTQKKSQYKTDTATDADYAITYTEYDAVGNVTKVTDPLGKATKTEYDSANRETKRIFALGTSDQAEINTTYTSTGLKWKVTDERTNVTETEYDAAGRPSKVYSPTVPYGLSTSTGRAITETQYDAAGNVVKTINPLGKIWDYEYDLRNRKRKEFRPVDATSTRPTYETEYDLAGNVKRTIGPRGIRTSASHWTDMGYDRANRLLTTTTPEAVAYGAGSVRAVTTNEYDLDGNITKVTDANGAQTVNTYDQMGRLETTTSNMAAGTSDDIVTTNGYDSVGNRTSVKDPKNNTTSFEYDGLNRNTKITYPSAGPGISAKFEKLEYDGVNKTARVDALNRRTLYGYDGRNRLKTVTYDGLATSDVTNSNRTYAYDASNNLTSVTEPNKTKANVTYVYDALNRIVEETSGGALHKYRYDLAGNRLKAEYFYGGVAPLTPLVLTSTYDEQNRLKTLLEDTRTTTYGYDLDGNRTSLVYASGAKTDTIFDLRNRKTEIKDTRVLSGVTQLQYQMQYDRVGNLKQSIEQNTHGTLDRTLLMTYDELNRLKTEQSTGAAAATRTTNFTYDKSSNMTNKVITGTGAASWTYVYNNLNQVTTQTKAGDTGTISYTYDDNGNRSTKTDGITASNATVTTYSWDWDNRLVSLQRQRNNPKTVYTFVYDYRSRRVERGRVKTSTGDPFDNIATGTDKVVFSGGTSVREIDAANNSVLVNYIRGSDWGGGVGGILYTLKGSAISTMHYNARGDVTMRCNANQSETYTGNYTAFGERIQESGSNPDRQKSNTKDEDVVGYANEGFRFRDIESGMFISRDPLGFVDGPNLYSYVNQNPWTKFDPEGLFWAEARDFAVGTFIESGESISSGFDAMTDPNSSGDVRFLGGMAVLGGVLSAGGELADYATGPGKGKIVKEGIKAGFEKAGKEIVENSAEKVAKETTEKVAEEVQEKVVKEVVEASGDLKKTGRQGKQAKLREIADDPKASSADRGWIKQELNEIEKGKKSHIRNPQGKDLAHERGREAAKGYGYEHSKLQNRADHKIQHKYDDFGRKNKERPVKDNN